MNIKNNKRRRESQNKIEKAFADMLLTKSINKISVTDICKEAGLNRTTFYANYIDIYDLGDKVRQSIEAFFNKMFSEERSRTIINFFRVIYDNQTMFKVYFKLAYDAERANEMYINRYEKELMEWKQKKYNIAFFHAGINAVIKMWLDNGCVETPEEMTEIIKSEYDERNAYFSSGRHIKSN